MTTLSVIGSAGRLDDGKRLNLEIYMKCLRHLKEVIEHFQVDTLVSGGAAWMDHLAVSAYLKNWAPSLVLALPAEFGIASNEFISHQHRDAGSTINYYHKLFSENIGYDSLPSITKAIKKGAITKLYSGFKNRNCEVAKTNYMIAYTFGSKSSRSYTPDEYEYKNALAAGLKPGGTSHTWNMATQPLVKLHVNLCQM